MNKNILTVSFAVFSMFFGAGNMVLPLLLMQEWSNYWLPAFIGFCITAVLVTLLGLIASVLVRGNIKNFFAPLGLVGGFILQFILIAVEGPFGVVPRSLIVAFGGIKTISPDFSPYLFYAISCIVIYFLAIDKRRIVKVIGNIVTPAMLIFLFIIIAYSFMQNGFDHINLNLNNSEAFISGLLEGYLTYDLPGAIYFTSIAMAYLIAISSKQEDIISNGMKASFISAILLITVYLLFTYLGLSHLDSLEGIPPEQILPNIIKGSLGSVFSIFFALFIFLACLSTAIAAVTIWSDFIHYYCPKLNYKVILGTSLSVAFMVSTLDFVQLMKLLRPLLNLVYPILIALSIYNVINYLKRSPKSSPTDQDLTLNKAYDEK